MEKLKRIYSQVSQIPHQVSKVHVGAYAAQAAYFLMLCMIPIILLLLTLVQFTPVTKADVMTAVIQVFPSSVDSMVASVVNQVYNQSGGIIPITLIMTMWSAGKGVLSITTGLNCIYGCPETRNYVFLRLRATLYTIMFIVVILLLLVLSVFGNSLNLFILEHLPFLSGTADWLIEARTVISPAVLVVFCLLIYKFLPNRRDRLIKQLPGAAFAALGWMVVSWIFSVYLDIFKGFSSMYGSLTTIVLIMLWMYFCMYSILLGGELNVLLYDELFETRERKKIESDEGRELLKIEIPNYKTLELEYLVLDYNGTIAVDGEIPGEIKERLHILSKNLEIYVLTSDTHGTAREMCEGLPLEIHTFPTSGALEEKLEIVEKLDSEKCAAIGNGRNDRLMCRASALSIAVLECEGMCSRLLGDTDVCTRSIGEALDLLLYPKRLIATLRG